MEQHQRLGGEAVCVRVPFVAGECEFEILEGELAFDPSDPFAVTMRLFAEPGTVVWTFARDLLIEGLYDPTGAGDVQVWPCLSPACQAVVIIELSSPDGRAMLQASSRLVRDFVDRTLALVPRGEETPLLPLDDMITFLLAD